MAKEIERKYLATVPGNLERIMSGRASILQGYVLIGEDGEMRLRRQSFQTEAGAEQVRYTQTVKSSGTLIRDEFEADLTKQQFDMFWPATIGRRLVKDRYTIPLADDLRAELDVFAGGLSGLVLGEVEFPDKESADEFVKPWYFGTDVTADKSYKNQQLARRAIAA